MKIRLVLKVGRHKAGMAEASIRVVKQRLFAYMRLHPEDKNWPAALIKVRYLLFS